MPSGTAHLRAPGKDQPRSSQERPRWERTDVPAETSFAVSKSAETPCSLIKHAFRAAFSGNRATEHAPGHPRCFWRGKRSGDDGQWLPVRPSGERPAGETRPVSSARLCEQMLALRSERSDPVPGEKEERMGERQRGQSTAVLRLPHAAATPYRSSWGGGDPRP